MKKTILMAATLVTALAATHAVANHDRRVVVRETHYSAPILPYHSGPVSVYVGPSHSTKVITISHRYDTRGYRYDQRASGYGKHAPRGKAYGYYGRNDRDAYRHKDRYNDKRHYGGHDAAYRGNYYGGHASSRGSWSGDRRDVIYVNKNARRNSNYRRVERNSVVIRERRR